MQLKPGAVTKLQELIAEENNPNLFLRIYVTGGGCSGFSYGFTLDEEQKSYQEAPNAFEQAWGTDIPNKEETIKEEGGLVKESSVQKFRSVQVSSFNDYISKIQWNKDQ